MGYFPNLSNYRILWVEHFSSYYFKEYTIGYISYRVESGMYFPRGSPFFSNVQSSPRPCGPSFQALKDMSDKTKGLGAPTEMWQDLR